MSCTIGKNDSTQKEQKIFECFGSDGKIYLHYDLWKQWRNQQDQSIPKPPTAFRFDIELTHPKSNFFQVPVDFNPHHLLQSLTARTCFYSCADWSIITDVHDAHHPSGDSFRMIVETTYQENFQNERIRLMSTSSSIDSEPFEQNNRFAVFRNKFWKISHFERMQSHSSDFYPLTNQIDPYVKHPHAIPPELLYQETKRIQQYQSLQNVDFIYKSPAWEFATSWLATNSQPILLGPSRFVVWKHQSPITKINKFLSIIPPETQGFPPAFCGMSDLTQGILSCLTTYDSPIYFLERIAPGSDRDRCVHFRVVEVIKDVTNENCSMSLVSRTKNNSILFL